MSRVWGNDHDDSAPEPSRYMEPALYVGLGLLFLSFGDDGGPGSMFAWWTGVALIVFGLVFGVRRWVTRHD